jgi:hypothetical protein
MLENTRSFEGYLQVEELELVDFVLFSVYLCVRQLFSGRLASDWMSLNAMLDSKTDNVCVCYTSTRPKSHYFRNDQINGLVIERRKSCYQYLVHPTAQ